MRLKSEDVSLLKLYNKYFNANLIIDEPDSRKFSKKIMVEVEKKYKGYIKSYTGKKYMFLEREKIYLKYKLMELNSSKMDFKYLFAFLTMLPSFLTFVIGLILNVNIVFSGNIFNKIAEDKVSIQELGKAIPAIWTDTILKIAPLTLIVLAVSVFFMWKLENYIRKREEFSYRFYSICYEIICSIEKDKL